jgi:hypothetical protein
VSGPLTRPCGLEGYDRTASIPSRLGKNEEFRKFRRPKASEAHTVEYIEGARPGNAQISRRNDPSVRPNQQVLLGLSEVCTRDVRVYLTETDISDELFQRTNDVCRPD